MLILRLTRKEQMIAAFYAFLPCIVRLFCRVVRDHLWQMWFLWTALLHLPSIRLASGVENKCYCAPFFLVRRLGWLEMLLLIVLLLTHGV